MFKKFVTFVTAAALIAAIAVPAMPAFAATKPDTPASVWWDEDKPTTAVWEAADHATRYEVYLYRVSDSGSLTKVKDVKVTKTQYNFSRDFNKEGDYVFKVRSLGSGSTSSSWTEESDSHYVTEAYASWVRDGMPAKNDSNSGPGVATALNQGTGTTSESASGPMQPDWRRNDKGWWYATTAAGDAWYASCWQWIDGNKDGIAECYCFDADGYMYENTTTPDGYTVNADGAWTVDGVVQTKAAE